MSNTPKKLLSAALVLCLIFSVSIFSVHAAVPSTKITTTPTGYTQADQVRYYTSGGTVANWGARGELCTFTSKYANEYYTGSYTFDSLATNAGGTSQSNAPQSALYAALQNMMEKKHKHETSYNETRDYYKFTDCVGNDTSKLSTFYTGKLVKSGWDGGKTYNREHTWPNSKGLNGNDENDIMMLRPENPNDNSGRGNTAYGISSKYFDPGVSVRGDCARIFLYIYVRWGNTRNAWGTGGVIENLDVLLQWMEEDPVDTWEMGRNDAVQSITGVRNVFVDYPEFAWLLFGREVPASASTPSKNQGTVPPSPPAATPTDPEIKPTDPIIQKPANEVATPATGSKVYIYSVQAGEVLSSNTSGSGLSGVTASMNGNQVNITDDMLQLSVTKDGNGYYTFQTADGKYLTSGDTGNALSLTDTKTEYSLWVIDSTGIKNVNATYAGSSGPRAQYLEYYNGKFTTYSFNSQNPDAYAFRFYALPDSGSTVCTHTHTEIRGAVSASCTKEGYTGDTYCVSCGKKLSSGNSEPKQDHVPVTGKPVEATCTQPGKEADVICSVCNQVLTPGKPIPKQDHVPVTGKPVEATCIQPGKEADVICSVCKQVLTPGAEIPATGEHKYGDWVITKEPSATENGEKSRTCAVCDKVETEAVPAASTTPTESTPTESTPTQTEPQATVPAESTPGKTGPSDNSTTIVMIVVAVSVAAVAGIGAAVITIKKKKQEQN